MFERPSEPEIIAYKIARAYNQYRYRPTHGYMCMNHEGTVTWQTEPRGDIAYPIPPRGIVRRREVERWLEANWRPDDA